MRASSSKDDSSNEKRPRLLVVSDFDSRITWSSALAEHFAADGFEVVVMLPKAARRLPLANLNRWTFRFHSVEPYLALSAAELHQFDVILLALGGGANLKALDFVREACVAASNVNARPIMITGFNGLVDETDIHGLLCRVGSDIICVNSARNLYGFGAALESLALPKDSLYLTGFVRSGLHQNARREVRSEVRCVVYADQTGIFASKKQARYVAEQLLLYAETFPDRELIIKLRPSWSVTTSEKESYCLRDALRHVTRRPPPNLIFDAGDPASVLSRADLVISFSSTMLIEGLITGLHCAVISDLGITTRLGNHVFVGSNLLCPFSSLQKDEIPMPHVQWLKHNVEFAPSRTEALVQHVRSLILRQAAIGRQLPVPDPGYSRKDTPFMYAFPASSKRRSFHSVSRLLLPTRR